MDQLTELIPPTSQKRIVIIGGGFGGIRLIRKLRGKGFQVVLLDKNNFHTFQPLLYQVASGGLEPDSIAYPLRKIFQGYPGFFFRMTEVKSVNAAERKVETGIGDISYDYLVIAAGSTNNFFGIKSIEENAMPLKQVTDALNLRSLLLQNMERALTVGTDRKKYLNIVIAGGGPTGVETAGALCELKKHVLPSDYPELNLKDAKIVLAEAGPALLGVMSEKAQQSALNSLVKMGVDVKLNTPVKEFDGNTVLFGDGTSLPCNAFIWSAGVKGVSIKGIDPSSVSKSNRIIVDRFNRVLNMDHIFAIGDIALMKEDKFPNGHPMVAQVALQQANNLAKNLIAIERSGTLTPFHYKELGSLATIGRNKAVADFPFLKISGIIAWFLWLVVHLMTLVGFRNRVVVLINWMWNYFSYDRAIRLIIRPYNKE